MGCYVFRSRSRTSEQTIITDRWFSWLACYPKAIPGDWRRGNAIAPPMITEELDA
jgi:hypothetical protein